ncbi:hypothetical protein [Gracilibacillus kekensis]|uniref:Uncharacterized protein n=1 Tax=Gracilibacillus kekensis TaxID=1027249 RepID=A0A1M7Q1V9_9BACI|nr:hypothetical protein [Gracilibacillus kekensis]SHN24155.1 hypothetical protein SAMN05216179_2743 [Gracilibacillus kekensis]
MDKYIMSISQLVLLLILSPALTDRFSSNLVFFLTLITVISIGNFTIEKAYNRKNYKVETKAKYMGLLTIPINTTVLALFVLFVFK